METRHFCASIAGRCDRWPTRHEAQRHFGEAVQAQGGASRCRAPV